MQQKPSEYVGRQVAAWELELEPRPDHFDKQITVHTPLKKAGAYLLTAKMAGGNSSQIIVWLEDTAIVKKPLSGGTYYYVADAVSGAPLAKANVEFFGYRVRSVGANRFTVDTQAYTHQTDADGQLVEPAQNKSEEFQWIITATTPEGRLAYLGFTGIWSGDVWRYRIQPDEGVRDYRSAGVSAESESTVQILGRPRQIRSGRQIGVCQPNVQC